MSYSDVEHFSNILSGCESLVHGDIKSPNSVYAFTVLKLHAQDAGYVAGTEGFLDNIKKGARSVVKWVKELSQAITNWIKQIFTRGPKSIETIIPTKDITDDIIKPSVERIEKDLASIDDFKELGVDVKKINEKLDQLVKTSEVGKDISKDLSAIRGLLISNSETLRKEVAKLKEGEDKVAGPLGKASSCLGRSLSVVHGIIKRIESKEKTGSTKVDPTVAKLIESGASKSKVLVSLIVALEAGSISMENWKETVKYADSKVPDLFDEYEESTISGKQDMNKEHWDTDYYNNVSSWRAMNFSKERVLHQGAVFGYLSSKGVKGFKLS